MVGLGMTPPANQRVFSQCTKWCELSDAKQQLDDAASITSHQGRVCSCVRMCFQGNCPLRKKPETGSSAARLSVTQQVLWQELMKLLIKLGEKATKGERICCLCQVQHLASSQAEGGMQKS